MAIGKAGKTSRIIVWGLLVLLVVGLAGFGARNFGGSQQVVARVGSTEIDANQYARALNQQLRSLSAQLGRNVDLTTAQSLGIDRALLGQLLATAAMENESARIGVSVGDEELANQLRQKAEFQGVDGSFDNSTYQFVLQSSGLKPRQYEERLRQELGASLVQTGVVTGLRMPATYADILTAYLGETRDFSWISIDEGDLETALPAPTEDELHSFYDAHGPDFMLPESKAITYAWLAPETVMDGLEIDEAELHALYDERASEFIQPERRLVERLIFPGQEAAQQAADAIAAGSMTFDELVTSRGLELEDVDMGDVSRQDLGPAADAVFAADGPGVVGPVETDLGPALFRINAVLAEQVTTFDDVRDELFADYAGDRARRAIADRIDGLDDELAAGATVEELARENGLELGQVDWFAGQSDGIAAYEGFATAAAAATVDDFPEIITLDDGGIFAMRVDEVLPARPEPFDAARAKVAEAWASQQLLARLADEAQHYVDRVKAGESLSALGKIAHSEAKVNRAATIAGAPEGLVTQIFEIAAGDTALVKGDGQVVIAELRNVNPVDPADPDLERLGNAALSDAAQSMARDVLAGFTQDIEQEAGISIDQNLVNAVHAQFP